MSESVNIFYLGLQTLLYVGGIVLACGFAGGLVAALVQAITNVHDQSFAYAFKLLGFIGAGYLLLPHISQAVIELAKRAFGS